MASASGTLKRLTLELGGNDAAIVLDDADPKDVAPKIYAAAMANAGQVCIAIKRLYVHDSIHDAVCEELGRLARETVVGDGLEPGTQMGPIQNQAQFEKVKGFLEDARQNGKIVAGGGVLEREGYFVQPTIVRDIPDNARLVREEQFGRRLSTGLGLAIRGRRWRRMDVSSLDPDHVRTLFYERSVG